MTGAEDRPLTDGDYQALAEFRANLRRFLAFSEQAARAEVITPAHHQLLLAIRGHPTTGSPTVTELAEHLQRRRHSVVELIERARDHDLVTSHADPDDARRRRIELTPHGHEVIVCLSALHRSELRDVEPALVAIFADLT